MDTTPSSRHSYQSYLSSWKTERIMYEDIEPDKEWTWSTRQNQLFKDHILDFKRTRVKILDEKTELVETWGLEAECAFQRSLFKLIKVPSFQWRIKYNWKYVCQIVLTQVNVILSALATWITLPFWIWSPPNPTVASSSWLENQLARQKLKILSTGRLFGFQCQFLIFWFLLHLIQKLRPRV